MSMIRRKILKATKADVLKMRTKAKQYPIRPSTNLSSDTIHVCEMNGIFMLLKENNSHSRILYLATFLFQTKNEIDISNQQRLTVYHSVILSTRSII